MSDWQQLALDAYNLLIRDRPIGLAVGPIPWTSIDRFVQSRLERGWIDESEAEDLEALLIGMDEAEITHRLKSPDSDKGGKGDDGRNESS